MSIHVTCSSCSAKFKAPESAAGKRTKCPRCGEPIQIPFPVEEAEIVEEAPVAQYTDDELAVEPPVEIERSNEGRKPCPMCGEMIQNEAVKCRYCGEIFDPLLKKQGQQKANRSDEDANLTTGEWVLAILCAGIGCIVGIVWMIQGKPKGGKMVGVSIAAVIFWNIVTAVFRAMVDAPR